MKINLPTVYRFIGKILLGIGLAGFFAMILLIDRPRLSVFNFMTTEHYHAYIFYLVHLPFIFGLIFMHKAKGAPEEGEQFDYVRHEALRRGLSVGITLTVFGILMYPFRDVPSLSFLSSSYVDAAPSIVLMMLVLYHATIVEKLYKMKKEGEGKKETGDIW